jgi:hypothetical protein
MFSGGNTSAWEKFSRADRTKWYGRTYDFSQIHQDNHYKYPGARPITKMKTGQPESELGGDPIFNQGRYVHPNYSFISCLSILNKRKMFSSTMCLKSCLYPHFGNDEWLLS